MKRKETLLILVGILIIVGGFVGLYFIKDWIAATIIMFGCIVLVSSDKDYMQSH